MLNERADNSAKFGGDRLAHTFLHEGIACDIAQCGTEVVAQRLSLRCVQFAGAGGDLLVGQWRLAASAKHRAHLLSELPRHRAYIRLTQEPGKAWITCGRLKQTAGELGGSIH